MHNTSDCLRKSYRCCSGQRLLLWFNSHKNCGHMGIVFCNCTHLKTEFSISLPYTKNSVHMIVKFVNSPWGQDEFVSVFRRNWFCGTHFDCLSCNPVVKTKPVR